MRRERAIAAATRSLWEIYEGIWYDVKLWLVVTVLVALLSAWRGLPWRAYTALTVLALSAVLGGDFLWKFIGILRHPDRNKSWAVEESRVVPDSESTKLHVSVEPKEALHVGRERCEVTDPEGRVWNTPEFEASPTPRLIRRLYSVYPTSYPGAPELVSGTYQIRWLLGTKLGGWREILRYEVEVNPD
jgi:hypothetical protein